MNKELAVTRPRFALVGITFEATWNVVRALFNTRLGWALPLLLALLAMAGLLALLTLVPAIAPFVYPLI